MLKGIHPMLTGELLHHLDGMGHGETLVVADANFPAHRGGAPVVELPGVTAAAALAAIVTVFPLDDYEDEPVVLMSADGDPRIDLDADGLSEVQRLLVAAARAPWRAEQRFDFYASSASAALVVRTGELRPYGNALLRKGVVSEVAA